MKAQAGICAEPNLHALYLMFNRTGDGVELAARLARLPVLWDAVSADFPDAGFSGLVAVGENGGTQRLAGESAYASDPGGETLYWSDPPLVRAFHIVVL